MAVLAEGRLKCAKKDDQVRHDGVHYGATASEQVRRRVGSFFVAVLFTSLGWHAPQSLLHTSKAGSRSIAFGLRLTSAFCNNQALMLGDDTPVPLCLAHGSTEYLNNLMTPRMPAY